MGESAAGLSHSGGAAWRRGPASVEAASCFAFSGERQTSMQHRQGGPRCPGKLDGLGMPIVQALATVETCGGSPAAAAADGSGERRGPESAAGSRSSSRRTWLLIGSWRWPSSVH